MRFWTQHGNIRQQYPDHETVYLLQNYIVFFLSIKSDKLKMIDSD